MAKSLLADFGRRESNPRLNKTNTFKASKTPLATNPVVARIRKSESYTGINVKQVSANADRLFAKAPKVQIRKV